jgi:RNA polymerase sigma factor (sigma-70 family)
MILWFVMAFPQTRLTLIERLASAGNDVDWQTFLADYWDPVCRFAFRSGNGLWQDAEDAASQTFLALVEQKLLVRWAAARSAKLRTLLCAVVRNVLANRARIQAARARLVREHGNEMVRSAESEAATDVGADEADAFYAAWADHVLEQTIDTLVAELQREGKGDQFRVLHGKICEEMTIAEIARTLGMTTSHAEQAYKDARKRLAQRLEAQVRAHVRRYASETDIDSDFAVEWSDLARYLKSGGGLEIAIRRALEQTQDRHASKASLTAIVKRLAKPRSNLPGST